LHLIQLKELLAFYQKQKLQKELTPSVHKKKRSCQLLGLMLKGLSRLILMGKTTPKKRLLLRQHLWTYRLKMSQKLIAHMIMRFHQALITMWSGDLSKKMMLTLQELLFLTMLPSLVFLIDHRKAISMPLTAMMMRNVSANTMTKSTSISNKMVSMMTFLKGVVSNLSANERRHSHGKKNFFTRDC
jgi:hypothetical protein